MIEAKNINKYFGNLHVLNNININLKSGSFTLLAGPNASGKSTLIKSLLQLVNFDGEFIVNEHKIHNSITYKEIIGYMPQNICFPENLTVKEIFDFVKSLRKSVCYDYELFDDYELDRHSEKKLKNLSGGTRQKVNAALAFLFDPKILLLDEPTAGLDPVASDLFKQKVLKENSRGKTILITSHQVSEFENFANEIILLIDGVIKYYGSIKELILKTSEQNLEKALARCIREMKN